MTDCPQCSTILSSVMRSTKMIPKVARLPIGESPRMEKKLAAARARYERVGDLVALKGELFLRYLHEGPEILYHWTPEQRVVLYRTIGFKAVANEDGDLSATWLFGAETFGVLMESTTR